MLLDKDEVLNIITNSKNKKDLLSQIQKMDGQKQNQQYKFIKDIEGCVITKSPYYHRTSSEKITASVYFYPSESNIAFDIRNQYNISFGLTDTKRLMLHMTDEFKNAVKAILNGELDKITTTPEQEAEASELKDDSKENQSAAEQENNYDGFFKDFKDNFRAAVNEELCNLRSKSEDKVNAPDPKNTCDNYDDDVWPYISGDFNGDIDQVRANLNNERFRGNDKFMSELLEKYVGYIFTKKQVLEFQDVVIKYYKKTHIGYIEQWRNSLMKLQTTRFNSLIVHLGYYLMKNHDVNFTWTLTKLE